MLAPTHDTTTLHTTAPSSTVTPAENNVVHLTGILDVRSVGDVRQTLNTLIDTSDGDVIVDLETVDAVDATGLGLLVATHRRTQLLGRQLVLWHPMPSVVRILAVTRLHRILHVERSPLPIGA
ncbi:STAS domain-containing protein [Kribbella sp. NBC_01510]|uniref:STAS domain-containing protein n=1 Tax=unclassified Kribbella TaxID=2644121 RepID=UPI002E327ACD|nr:STAS domain-containing protein [Kribbella sp. NBC_01484]